MRTFLSLALVMTLLAAEGGVPRPFAIEIVDAATGRGVPLVELETVNHQRFVTDSNGLVVLTEPDLMGQSIYFHVQSHGYEYSQDGFGYRGKVLKVEAGGHARLELARRNIAERLYRVTGGGIYRDTVLLGRQAPLRAPLLNGKVFGSDSVSAVVYRGKVYWFWGDTHRPDYPLGNFSMSGATSLLPGKGGLDPARGVDLDYFTDPKTGFARPVGRMPGEGPTWLDGLVVLKDVAERERLFAFYAKIAPKKVVADQAYERGLAEWDDRAERFEHVATFARNKPINPGSLPTAGHAFLHTEDGIEYVYYANPYPLRVRARPESLKDPANYEVFTCLAAESRPGQPVIDRDGNGMARYGWRRGAPAFGPKVQAELIRAGHLKPEEALLLLRDADTDRPVTAHGGSVCWNPYRGRWVMIAVEIGGEPSFLGEVWYAEADAPTGPWVWARKVVTHEKYTFYNPEQHPFFDQDGGRVIFFEGSYTRTFSGNPDPTPRYDYNQVMYKLDLSDPRLNLPVALYNLADGAVPDIFGMKQPGREVSFFALERPGPGTVPVFAGRIKGSRALQVGQPPGEGGVGPAAPLFHALPTGAKTAPATTTPLYECIHKESGRRAYSIDRDWSQPGYRRTPEPICLVWKNPCRVFRRSQK